MSDFKTQLIKAYNKDATRRDEMKERDPWKVKIRQKFVDILKKEDKKTVLELGSGAGIDAKFFADNGFDVLATDLSPEMVKMCEKRGLSAKVVDLYELSELGKKFDAIFSINVLLHVPKKDLKKVLDNIADALKDDGIFFYGVYGGVDSEETITDKSRVPLPRFFSFLSDDSLKEKVSDRFEIMDFEAIDIGSKRESFHFQAMFLRKK